MPTSPDSQPLVPPEGGIHMLMDERIQKEQRERLRRRLLRIITGLCILLLVINLVHALTPKPAPGGLDGCLNLPGGAPLVAAVQVDSQTTTTGADGCFYFAELPAGNLTLRVEVPSGMWEQSVAIQSGQATGLGDITIDPARVTK